jgi:hypothetical protein
MRYMHNKPQTTLTINQFAALLGVSRDMALRWWHAGILKGAKKNPFARNSPVIIQSSEVDRVKKVLHETRGKA